MIGRMMQVVFAIVAVALIAPAQADAKGPDLGDAIYSLEVSRNPLAPGETLSVTARIDREAACRRGGLLDDCLRYRDEVELVFAIRKTENGPWEDRSVLVHLFDCGDGILCGSAETVGLIEGRYTAGQFISLEPDPRLETNTVYRDGFVLTSSPDVPIPGPDEKEVVPDSAQHADMGGCAAAGSREPFFPLFAGLLVVICCFCFRRASSGEKQ